MNSKIISLCLLISLWVAPGILLAQSGSVSFQNNSGASLKILRGQNPGGGNSVGQLAPGQTVVIQTAKGRIYSFMSGTNMVASYRSKGTENQVFAITNAMVRAVDPSALNVPTNPAPRNLVNSNQPNANNNRNKQKNGTRNAGGGATGSNLTAAESLQFLNAHNDARQKVGVGKVLWSPQIAAWAQQQADRIAQSGVIAHTANAPYGENLGVGTGAYGPIDAANGWISEKVNFRRGDSPVISGDRVTAHYTQVVWRETSEVGAGKAIVQKGQWKGATVVVGAYNPRGNLNRRAPF